MLRSKTNVHVDVPQHNAVAALPPFVVDFHSNRISFLTGLLPRRQTQVTSAGLAASPRNPKNQDADS